MQAQRQPRREGTLHLLRRFGEFMHGSAWKYLGSIFAVGVTIAVSFLTPLLIAGTVDAITDALSGVPSPELNLPVFVAAWFEARGGAQELTVCRKG